MNADERDKRYRALLEGPNTGLLVEIARETFRAVMKRIGTLQGIKVHELKVDDIADLAGARDLLVRKKIRIRDQEVTFAGVGHALREEMRGRSDYRMFRKRCQHLPRLYQLLVEHRNLQQHHVNEPPTTSDVTVLCGVVLSILDVCILGPDRTERLATQCAELIRAVTATEAETELATRLAEQGRENEVLKGKLAHLREHTANGKGASELETLETRLGGRLEAAVDQIRAEIASSTEKLENVVALSEEEAGRLRAAEHELQALAEVAYPDELLDPLSGSIDQKDSRQEPSDITPSMAEDRLRDLRDKIRSEMEVDPWQNICMTQPIVRQAVWHANRGEVDTLDDWRHLPEVHKKYTEHGESMERQIERYGDEMMSIYRRVERSS